MGTPTSCQFIEARDDEGSDAIKIALKGKKPLRFDWENKWLRGDQYAHMLFNLNAYCQTFGFPRNDAKQHPENIYV